MFSLLMSLLVRFSRETSPTSTRSTGVPLHAVVGTVNSWYLLLFHCSVITATRVWHKETETNERLQLQPANVDAVINPLQQPVQALVYDHRDGVEERVCTTHSQKHQQAVCNLVCPGFPVLRSLAAHQVSKPHGAEGHKAEIKRFQISPAFHCRVKRGSYTCNQLDHQEQDDGNLIHRWFQKNFSVIIAIFLLLVPVFSSASVALRYDVCDEGYHSFQEEVEEKYGGWAAKQTIENQQDLSRNSRGRRHPKSCKRRHILKISFDVRQIAHQLLCGPSTWDATAWPGCISKFKRSCSSAHWDLSLGIHTPLQGPFRSDRAGSLPSSNQFHSNFTTLILTSAP